MDNGETKPGEGESLSRNRLVSSKVSVASCDDLSLVKASRLAVENKN